MAEIYLDVETTSWFDSPEIKRLPRAEQVLAMRFGLAVTFDEEHRWRIWLAGEEAALWDALQGHRVVGWNSEAFDLPVVRHHAARTRPELAEAPYPASLDPFAVVRALCNRWYSLDLVAQVNLGRGKTGHGRDAAEDILSGDPLRVARAAFYCRDDVELTLELAQILLDGERLLFPARPERSETTSFALTLGSDGESWSLHTVRNLSQATPPALMEHERGTVDLRLPVGDGEPAA